MPSAIQIKSKAVAYDRISGILVLAGLILSWSAPVLSADETVDPEPSLRMAPIRYRVKNSGAVDFVLRYDKWHKTQILQRVYGVTVNVGANAESFIWQPWLVKVGTDINASMGTQLMDIARDGWGMAREDKQVYRGISGGGMFKVLPYSRIPLEVNFRRSNDQYEVGLDKAYAGGVGDSVDVTQIISSRSGATRYQANLSLTKSEDRNANISKSKLLGFNFVTQPFSRQSLAVMGARNSSAYSFTSSSVSNDYLAANHTYKYKSFAWATRANRSKLNYKFSQESSGGEILQLSGTGNWRLASTPVTMTGGVRLSDSSSHRNGITIPGEKFTGANLGLNYAWAKWLRVYASAEVYDIKGVQTSTSSSLASNIFSLSFAAQHRPDNIKLGKVNYKRYVAASVTNGTGTTVSDGQAAANISQSAAIQLQHGLDNATPAGTGTLSSAFSQAVSASSYRNPNASTKGSQPAPNFLNNISVSWGRAGTQFRVTGTDNRTRSGSRDYYQNIHLQGSQTENLGGIATLQGNITVDAARRGAGSGSPVDTMTATSSLTYNNTRAFNVYRMTLFSSLRVITADLLHANPEGIASSQGSYDWDNKLKYGIGRLGLELNFALREVRSSRMISLIFHARRSF